MSEAKRLLDQALLLRLKREEDVNRRRELERKVRERIDPEYSATRRRP